MSPPPKCKGIYAYHIGLTVCLELRLYILQNIS
jgi:hypothetical protein